MMVMMALMEMTMIILSVNASVRVSVRRCDCEDESGEEEACGRVCTEPAAIQ